MDPRRADHPKRTVAAVVGLTLTLAPVLSACGVDGSPDTRPPAVDTALSHPDGWPGVPSNFPEDLLDPVKVGVEPPDGFRQILRRDWIAPVYNPTFVTAEEIGWDDEELVIGVDLEGQARAYPVGFLSRREIVVDMHRGIPTFVTW